MDALIVPPLAVMGGLLLQQELPDKDITEAPPQKRIGRKCFLGMDAQRYIYASFPSRGALPAIRKNHDIFLRNKAPPSQKVSRQSFSWDGRTTIIPGEFPIKY